MLVHMYLFARCWCGCTCLLDVGADVLDLTGQNAETFGHLQEEDVSFELTPSQRLHFDNVQRINAYLRNEYHALHEYLWNSGYNSKLGSMPKRLETLTARISVFKLLPCLYSIWGQSL